MPATSAATEGGNAMALVLVLAGIFIAIIVPYIIRRTRRAGTPESVPVRKQWNERKTASKARHSADRILVDLAETSREISGRMDTKIRILNTLIRDAERCIARLEELQGRKPADTPFAITPPVGIAGRITKAEPEAEPPPPPPAEEDEGETSKPAVEDGLSNGMSANVAALLEEGFSVPEIARRLEISRREVKLIQALRDGEDKNPRE